MVHCEFLDIRRSEVETRRSDSCPSSSTPTASRNRAWRVCCARFCVRRKPDLVCFRIGSELIARSSPKQFSVRIDKTDAVAFFWVKTVHLEPALAVGLSKHARAV